MKKVLAVFSSLNGESGNSTTLARDYLNKLTASDQASVTTLDVADLALPHLTQAEMQAWMTEENARSDEQVALAKQADEIVLAVPMYNFGIPSSLKAYFDRIARAGITFKYTETGPVGLLENKSATVFSARGGIYAGSDFDTQTPYLKHFLNFIGIKEINFVYAEGLNMGEEQATKSIEQAKGEIVELLS